MSAHTRLIHLNVPQTQYIPIQNNQSLEIVGNQLSFWGEGKDLFVYEDGQLKAVLQNYYEFFQAAPNLNSSGHYSAAIVTSPQITETPVLLASQTNDNFATTSIYTGGNSKDSAGWIIGGLLIAGAAAAAAGGGGSDDEDSSEVGILNNHSDTDEFTDVQAETAGSKPYFIEGLLAEEWGGFLKDPNVWKGAGNAIKISYSFADSAIEYVGSRPYQLMGYQPFTENQKADIRQIMLEYSRYSNITFEEVKSDYDADFVIYFDNLNSVPVMGKDYEVAYAYYGGNLHLHTAVYGADDAFDADKQVVWAKRNGKLYPYHNGYSMVLHELGHVLGLSHPFDDNKKLRAGWTVAEDMDITTVMSYTAYERIKHLSSPNGNMQFNNVGIYQKTLGVYDIAALNYLYGVNRNFHSGDDTYTFGKFNYKASGNGAISNVYIADGGGNDTIDASNQRDNVFIDLASGSWNYVGSKASTLAINSNGAAQEGQLFIGYGSQIENAKGGSGNDKLTGNSADNILYGNSGADTFSGGAGNDQLEGGQGSDILIGGTGADSFIFRSQFDNSVDKINDFNAKSGDRIVLGQSIFSQLAIGAVNSNHFVLGEVAADADDYLIFNSRTHELLYDRDGNGADAAVAIAILDKVSSLSADQIFII